MDTSACWIENRGIENSRHIGGNDNLRIIFFEGDPAVREPLPMIWILYVMQKNDFTAHELKIFTISTGTNEPERTDKGWSVKDMTQTERKPISANRVTSEMFAQVFQSYLECSDEVQAAIRDMVQIINSNDATEEEREAAVSTISEALFPSTHNGELGIDMQEHEDISEGETKKLLAEMNAEEATFAKRLEQLMEHRNMTQGDLAQAVGVGQSAISMMLARDCRPQKRTVEKLADALKVSVEDLWPGMKRE